MPRSKKLSGPVHYAGRGRGRPATGCVHHCTCRFMTVTAAGFHPSERTRRDACPGAGWPGAVLLPPAYSGGWAMGDTPLGRAAVPSTLHVFNC